MKKIIAFAVSALLVLNFVAAAPAITTTQLMLNLGDIETRIDCGFTDAIPIEGAEALNSDTTSSQTITISAAQDGDHISISDATFYIWYYISTVVSNVSLSLDFSALSDYKTPSPDYIDFTLTVSDVNNVVGETAVKEGSHINITTQPLSTNDNATKTLTILPSSRVAGLNRGFIKCDISNYVRDLETLTDSNYYTTLTLTLTSV